MRMLFLQQVIECAYIHSHRYAQSVLYALFCAFKCWNKVWPGFLFHFHVDVISEAEHGAVQNSHNKIIYKHNPEWDRIDAWDNWH